MDPSATFPLLANQVRRAVLMELKPGDTTGVEDLARHLADHPAVEDIHEPEQAHIRLVHVDLPLLAEHDAIEYERNAGRLTLTETGEGLVELLRVALEEVEPTC